MIAPYILCKTGALRCIGQSLPTQGILVMAAVNFLALIGSAPLIIEGVKRCLIPCPFLMSVGSGRP
jgi:hypothetical protein